MKGLGRLRMLGAFATMLARAPKEVEDLMNAPRVAPLEPEGTMKTPDTLEVEMPSPGRVLSVPHAMAAIVKAKRPDLNRKQRRQMAHRLQAAATKKRT